MDVDPALTPKSLGPWQQMAKNRSLPRRREQGLTRSWVLGPRRNQVTGWARGQGGSGSLARSHCPRKRGARHGEARGEGAGVFIARDPVPQPWLPVQGGHWPEPWSPHPQSTFC